MIANKVLRRRFDYQLLRWQARLDGAWADRVIPVAVSIGLFIVLAALSLARARSLETGTELAKWVQGAWMLTRHDSPDVTVDGSNLFSQTGAFGFYPIALLTRVFAPIPTLLIIQAFALAFGVIPVWRLCRNVCSLRVGAAAAAVVAYAVYPPLHQLNLADFHPVALAVPALLMGAYAGFRQRWWWAIAFFVGAMSLSAHIGLVVAAIGVVLALEMRTRHGARLVLLGVVWTLVSILMLQPIFSDGTFAHADAFSAYGTSLGGVVWGMLTDPLSVLGDLVERQNFVALVMLLAPVAFLPLLATRFVVPVAPVIALLFIADVPVVGPEGASNLVPIITFVFLALPFALGRLGRRNIERITVDRRLLGALTLATMVFFVQDSPSSPYAEPWRWGGRSLTDQARVAAIGSIEPGDRVRATVPTAAELASRAEITVVKPTGQVTAQMLTVGVDVVLLDPSVSGRWTDLRRVVVSQEIQAEGFELVLDRGGVQLYVLDTGQAD